MSIANRLSPEPPHAAALAAGDGAVAGGWPLGFRPEVNRWLAALRAGARLIRAILPGRSDRGPDVIRVPPMSAEWMHDRNLRYFARDP